MNFLRLQELAWNSPLTPKFLMSVGVIVGAYTLHRLVRYYVGRRTHDPMVRQGYWDISRNLTIFVGAAFLLGVWLEEMKTVSLLLTGLMAAFLIASKEVVLGVSGRIALATSSHFRVGDRILVNGVCGDVVNIGLLYTWLLEVGGEHGENQSTGRVVVFPNLWLTLYQVSNFTHLHEFLWDEIELAFPASIAIPEAMELMNAEAEDYLKDEMQRAARALPRLIETYAARLPPVTPIVYCRLERTALGDQYVVLTLRFVTQAAAPQGLLQRPHPASHRSPARQGHPTDRRAAPATAGARRGKSRVVVRQSLKLGANFRCHSERSEESGVPCTDALSSGRMLSVKCYSVCLMAGRSRTVSVSVSVHTGVTNALTRRVAESKAGSGSKIYSEIPDHAPGSLRGNQRRSDGHFPEKPIKEWGRAKKAA